MRTRQPRYADIYKTKPEMAGIASRVWRETMDFLKEHGLVNARRIDIADRYARACAEYEVLYPTAADEGPVKVGPNGGDVFNFNWSTIEKLNDRMGKFETALLIAPQAAQGQVASRAPTGKKTVADSYLEH